jgi:WD40 repeat protein
MLAGDGSRLLTGSADHSARALLLPLARHKGSGTDFRGHDAPIAAVSWSLDGSSCLTAGMDRWVACRAMVHRLV